MTVSELVQRMTAAEEAHWIAFYRREPFGHDRQDMGFAQISQILYNTNVKKKDAKSLTDFMPFYRKPIKKDPDVDTSVKSVFAKIINRKGS